MICLNISTYHIQATGSDTRPPMLDRTDYESWSQRIRLYCRGKENGLHILLSIDQGPFELGTTKTTLGTTPEGGVLLGPERPLTYDDLSDNEKKRHDVDVRATNIVLQGLPKDIYKLINHNIEAKAIGTMSKCFLARMTMPNIQLNSMFVNNMSPEWDRFVTAVKLNKGLKEINRTVDAYLKQHVDGMLHRSTDYERITQPQNQLHLYQTVPTLCPWSHHPQFPETSQIDSGHTQTDEILDNLTKQMAFLAQSFRATLPQTNNQFQTSSNTRNQATVQDGRIVDKMLLMQLKRMVMLDEEELPFWLVHILENAIDHSVTTQTDMRYHNKVTDEENVIDSTSDVMGAQNPFYLRQAKKAQPALYDGEELLKTHHVPVIVPSSEEDLKLAEATRNKMHAKMNDSACVEKRKTYLTEVKKSLVTEVRAMKAVFENLEAEVDQNEIDLKSSEIERKNLLIANENLIAECLSKDVFYTATDSVLNVSRFSDIHDAFTTAQKRIANLESENFNLRNKIQNDDHDSLIKHFSKLKVIQSRGNTIRELKEKNSHLTKKNSDVDPLFDLKALVSHNKELTAKLNALHDLNERFRAENAKVKHHYKELYDSIKITCAKTIEQKNPLLTEIENLKAQLKENSKCVTISDGKPKVLTPGRYLIDVEPIPPRLKNNREVHLDYIKHLKESVETLREIVEEAKVDRPLDTSLASACRYTKHSQELLEHVIGTCPKDFNPRDKQNASTTLLRKKRVTFVEPCETLTHNPPAQVEHQKINSPNAPGIPSPGVKGASTASSSKPRSNTKKDRTLPAKSALKQV
ncbi:hypothetical protein Tco_0180639 [Tanacetum coccineum]